MDAVIDASSLIPLARLRALEALFSVYGPVAITDEVFREVVVEGKKLGKADAWEVEKGIEKGWLERISLTPEEKALASEFKREFRFLGPGECEALACAEKRGLLLIVEERKTRTVARIRGIPYTVAQAIPVEGYTKGKLPYDKAVELLEEIAAAMNTELAVLVAFKKALAALEEERKRRAG